MEASYGLACWAEDAGHLHKMRNTLGSGPDTEKIAKPTRTILMAFKPEAELFHFWINALVEGW